jgi:hypothetical protein
MMFVPYRKHTDESLRLVAGIALLLYMYMMFVPHRKYVYGCPQPVTGIALLLYMYMMFVPILLVALGPGVYSASNRNEYQKHKNNVSGE